MTFKRPGPAPCGPWPDSRLLWGRATGRGQLASQIHSDSGLPVPAGGLRSRLYRQSTRCGAGLHLVVELGVHPGVHLVDDVDGGRVIDQEEADLLQAFLLRHVLALGERFEEVGLIGGRVQRCLEMGDRGWHSVRGGEAQPPVRFWEGMPPRSALGMRPVLFMALNRKGQMWWWRGLCVCPFLPGEGQQEALGTDRPGFKFQLLLPTSGEP